MNAFIKNFENSYIYEIQHIPYYNSDKVDGVTVRKELAWFDEEELEQVLESAKNVVAKYLNDQGCGWVLEKVAFADSIEELIMYCMMFNCLNRLLDENSRKQKEKEDPRLEEVFEESSLYAFRTLLDNYDVRISDAFRDIMERAKQSLEKPKVALAQ